MWWHPGSRVQFFGRGGRRPADYPLSTGGLANGRADERTYAKQIRNRLAPARARRGTLASDHAPPASRDDLAA